MPSYTISTQKLINLLAVQAIESRLLKAYIAEILDENNIMSKNDFYDKFKDYSNKNSEKALQSFLELSKSKEYDLPFNISDD